MFSNTDGLCRCPINHTCDSSIELPVSYSAYPEFKSNFTKILNNEEFSWIMDCVFSGICNCIAYMNVGHLVIITFLNNVCFYILVALLLILMVIMWKQINANSSLYCSMGQPKLVELTTFFI